MSRDQNQMKNQFLLSLQALSICTWKIGGKGLAGGGSYEEGGKEQTQASKPCKMAL